MNVVEIQGDFNLRINYIYNTLLTSKEINLKNFSFLSSSPELILDYKKLYNLSKVLDLTNYNDDIDFQEELLGKLYKIITGLAITKYEANKLQYSFVSAASINNALLELFFYRAYKNDRYLKELIIKICDFCHCDYNDKKIDNYTDDICKAFNSTHTLSLESTSEFANYVLNKHRNWYINERIDEYLAEVLTKLNVNTKHRNKNIKDNKILSLKAFILNKDCIYFNKLSEELNLTKKNILDSNYSKKISGNFLESDLEKLINLILNGNFKKQDLINMLNIEDSKTLKFIINLFVKCIYKVSNEISDVSFKSNNIISKVHYNKHLVFDYERYLYNISKLIVHLDMTELDKFLSNYNLTKEVIELLPLVGLIKDFNLELFIQLIFNYPFKDNSFDVLNKFSYLLNESSNIASINDINSIALGKNVVNNVGEENASKYLEVYKNMLINNKTSIPPLNMNIRNYSFISGNLDVERLLIGNIPDRNSCIDLLNVAGVETYKELLTSSSGDVILVRNTSNQICSRIILVRRGNVVLMVNNSKSYLLNINEYKQIADEIISKSIENNDNIDFVFFSNTKLDILNMYPRHKDSRFVSLFPHADFEVESILLSSKYKELDVDKINFEIPPASIYDVFRKELNYNTSLEDVYKIKALYLCFTQNLEYIDKKNIILEDYTKAISGEDWLLLYSNDEIVEELVLPTANSKSLEELSIVKEKNKIRIYH